MGRDVTDDERETCYRIAKQFYDKDISKSKATEDLTEELLEYDLPNEKQANDLAKTYMHSFDKLWDGESITFGVSIAQFKIFLENVLEDYGKERLKKFLKGMEGHIEYRRGKNKPIKGLSVLHNKFSQEIGMGASYDPQRPYNKI